MEMPDIDTSRLRESHILSRREDCKSEEVSKSAKKHRISIHCDLWTAMYPVTDETAKAKKYRNRLRNCRILIHSESGKSLQPYEADLQRKKMIICEKNSYRCDSE